MQPAKRLELSDLVFSTREADRARARRPRRRWGWIAAAALLIGVLGLVLGAEIRTSWVQSRLASRLGQELTWSLEAGPSARIAFPRHGPYDARMGYTRLARVSRRLEARGFEVSAQVRMSPAMVALERLGISPPHPEKAAAGLTLIDRRRELLFDARFPAYTWERFEDLPPLVVKTLLFIENRELLDTRSPYANPAVEWDRLLRAITTSALPGERRTPGASTLATQLEKYRHSPGGRTTSASEKLRQMAAASLRAYHAGPDTREARQRIVLDYLNTVPLAARPGAGEVTGLGDGLRFWHGADPAEVMDLLASPGADPARRGEAYAQVLSLLLSERRPSYYLLRDRRALGELMRSHLSLLAAAGIIDETLRGAALAWRMPEALPPLPAGDSEGASKATTALRAHMLELLGVRDFYALDRLDVGAQTTLDARAQREVEALLAGLRDPQRVAELGLRGERLLARGDLGEVVYSVLVFERTPLGNALRVQADTLAQPFNVNEGMKLDLGSTAKLRTLVHYLQIVADLHDRFGAQTPRELAAQHVDRRDPITRWVVERMAAEPGIPVERLLSQSLERTYSASPHEGFFTGGGVHRFANFDKNDNTRRVTLRDAFTRSVNLPFVRLMREIVHHVLYGPDGRAVDLADDPAGWARRSYLQRFAQSDSRSRLARFHARHVDLSPQERIGDVLTRVRPVPQRLAAFHAWLWPDAGPEHFAAFLEERLPGHGLAPERVESLHRRHAPDVLSDVDRARVMRMDPLELWMIDFLRQRPDAGERELWASSADVREADWAWIYRTRNERARERRVATMLERDAFAEIHRVWQRLGYPFDSLVPSLATAIGASADRPAALAELVGIIIADGVRAPMVRVERLQFAAGTPYETHLERRPTPGQRVLRPEVARLVRSSLVDVVENGTARRARDLLAKASDPRLDVGGKTGTGDRRIKRFAPGGRLIDSTAASRSATFVFAVGDRYFGVVTAYVEGTDSGHFEFTSSLPVQILKLLESPLTRLVRAGEPHRVLTRGEAEVRIPEAIGPQPRREVEASG